MLRPFVQSTHKFDLLHFGPARRRYCIRLIVFVQVDERTDLLGYRLQCGQCHTNLTLGSQNQLSFQYLLHSGATVFSVSSVQSVTLHLFLTLSGLLHTNSLWLNSEQTADFSSQALLLGLLAFPPGLRQSARARFRYRPDLFQFCRPLPSACISRSFRPFFYSFSCQQYG